MKHLLLTTIAALVLVGCGRPPLSENEREMINDVLHMRIEKVKQHLDAGVNVNARRQRDGKTPLHLTAWFAQTNMAELLIAKGADINSLSDNGETPLDQKTYYKNEKYKVYYSLLRKHGAKHSTINKALAAGNPEALKELIADGADVHARDDWMNTPLHEAVRVRIKSKEFIELLISAGADVNAKNKDDDTSLHFAASRDYKPVQLLLSAGADVNAKDKDGDTPLHRAAKNDHKEIAELLIAKGANVNANRRGGTPLDLAIEYRCPDTADLLRKHGGKTGEELKAEGE